MKIVHIMPFFFNTPLQNPRRKQKIFPSLYRNLYTLYFYAPASLHHNP